MTSLERSGIRSVRYVFRLSVFTTAKIASVTVVILFNFLNPQRPRINPKKHLYG